MSSYSDLATQIINKKGEGGRFSGLNQFLDVKQAFAEAQRKFQLDQALAREQGRNSGYASIINSANVNGTDPGPALNQFNQAIDNRGVLTPTTGASDVASGAAPIQDSSKPNVSISNTDTGFIVRGSPASTASIRNESVLAGKTADRQALIKRIADYAEDPRTLNKGNAGRVLAGQVAQYDPSFDASTYPDRRSFIQQNWNKGELSKTRSNLENLPQHLSQLKDAFDKMNNGNVLITNAAGNQAKVQLGKKEVTNAKVIAQAAGTELAKVLRGGGVLNEQEQQESQQNLNVSASPEQMHGAIQTMMHLTEPRMNNILEKYKEVMGKYPKDAFSPELIESIKAVSPDVYNRLAPKLGVEPIDIPMSGSSGVQVNDQPDNNGYQTTPLGAKYKVIK